MAIKFEKIKAGDILYDVHSYRMGHTKMRSFGCWDVRIIEVDAAGRRAFASWNGNTPGWMYERSLRKLRANRPEFDTSVSGRQTLKRKPKKLKSI